MRICIISNQVAAFGKIGGFGTATRSLGRELTRMGHEVHVVTPKHGDQQRVEDLDGMMVHGTSFRGTLLSGPIMREISADIYLSQEPSLPSYAAQRACPNASHVIVCRDPRGAADILVELRYATAGRRLRFPFQYMYEFQPLVKLAVRRADRVLMPTPTYLRQKIQRLYGLNVEPQFVPSTYLTGEPPNLPKSSRPTFISVGRWDRRKRMDLFFQLAKRRPDYQFIAVGRAHSQREDRRFRAQYGSLPNLHMPGHVDLFGGRLWDYYDTSWALVNTAAREGLPQTFLEALSRECALVSAVNPEGYTERFGTVAASGDVKSFLDALDLVAENYHETAAMRQGGREEISRVFSLNAMVDGHVKVFSALFNQRSTCRQS